MSNTAIAISCIALIAIGLAYWLSIRPGVQERRLVAMPFPDAWDQILHRNVPIYPRLPETLKQQVRQHIKLFIHRKTFYGCGGLTITDEIKVTIAGIACLLLLNRPTNEFYNLQYILVYPESYRVDHQHHTDGGVITPGTQGRLGESWQQGKIVLSWHDVKVGAEDFTDGENVVLHEFAHQLDQETGAANGAPLLPNATRYRSWAAALSKEFIELRQDADNGLESLMNHYGATNEAEFFAVATETFFEKPIAMAAQHPTLFEELKRYYQIDPREWI